jgi:hypothetical protein
MDPIPLPIWEAVNSYLMKKIRHTRRRPGAKKTWRRPLAITRISRPTTHQ